MIFDAFPLIGHLLGTSDESTALLAADGPRRAVAVNVAECYDALGRVHGVTVADIDTGFDLLETGGLVVVPVDRALAREAGRLRVVHYRKRACELSLADCHALAAAVASGEELVACDPPLAVAARAEGVTVIGVPDSEGKLP